MKNEFTLAFNEVLEEKQLPQNIVLEALEAAMVSAYRRAVNASNAQQVEASIDPETGKVLIFAEKEVVESVEDSRTEVTVRDAQKVDPNAQIGSMVLVETTPRNFGRVAAQTARQVIQQRIREAERDAQQRHFAKHQGEIVSGVVQAVNPSQITIGLDMKAEGVMMRQHQIPGERFRVHDRVRALLLEVKMTTRGPQINLSRAHRNFLRRLLENEVPEIYQGMVEIRSIAREPGQRSKVAVAALQAGVDPVGACVGIKGVRIQAIVRELNDEKIDVIEWNADPAAYIAKALSPARVSGVFLDEHTKGAKTATVVVPEDQLSLAIGRDGQNARLAAKLTSWRIDIKSLPEAASDSLYKLQNDPTLAALVEPEKENAAKVEEMLARKADGRPLTPEEYDFMTRFVDRVERRATIKTAEQKKEEEDRIAELRKGIPASAFTTAILDSGLPEHVAYLLQEAGYATVSDLAIQMKADSDNILRLQGIGPRAMENINALMASLETQAAAETEVEKQKAEAEAAVEVLAPVVEPEPVPVEEFSAPEVEEVVPETVEEPVTEPEKAVEEAEEEPTLEELFTLRPEVLETVTVEDEEETDEFGEKKKKGKKKSKHVEVTYDPDRDTTTVRKKHKRGGGWDWEE